jgi:hypothetical protein
MKNIHNISRAVSWILFAASIAAVCLVPPTKVYVKMNCVYTETDSVRFMKAVRGLNCEVLVWCRS